MADIAYPGGLPDVPLVDSWSMSDPYADPLTTDLGGNNMRQRQLAGFKVSQVQFDIMYTAAQWATLLNWVVNTCGGGTARIAMRVWNGGAMVGPKSCRFAAKLTPASIPPGKVRVTWKLWVYNLV